MSKTLQYLDLEKATIAALRDFRDQEWKCENDPKRIKEISHNLSAPRSAQISPVRGGSSQYEEHLCEALDKKTAIQEGHRQALEYQQEFMPCWERLNGDERTLLEFRFVDYYEGRGIEKIMQKFGINKTQAYERSNQALSRLKKLLFW